MGDAAISKAGPPVAQVIGLPPQEDHVDVHLKTGKDGSQTCYISDQQLESIRERAIKTLKEGIDRGYKNLPIGRHHFLERTVNKMFTKDNICTALTAPIKVTEKNHNELRKDFINEALDPEEARKLGMIAARIKLSKTSCPARFGQSISQFFNGVEDCDDVFEEIDDINDDGGAGVVMHAVKMDPKQAQDLIADPMTALCYNKYANDGPVVCSNGKSGTVTFHSLDVSSLYTANFVMRATEGAGSLAWTLLKSCQAKDGTVYEADDLKFNFGYRTFEPIEVNADGKRSTWTLTMSSFTGASNSWLAGLAALTPQLPYHRYIGSEYVRRLLLIAEANCWEIKQSN